MLSSPYCKAFNARGLLRFAEQSRASRLLIKSPSLKPKHSAVKASVEPAEDGFLTLVGKTCWSIEVKRSKFEVTGWPITSALQALELIASARVASASHNCYAFKVDGQQRSNDDGEPAGTAGRPILGSIESEHLDGVCVLVTRYFGGTKLGTGGLARAYGRAARELLGKAPKEVIRPQQELTIEAPFEAIGAVYQVAERHRAERLGEDFSEGGAVTLRLRVDVAAAAALNAALLEATSGAIAAEEAEPRG